jgi:hypothetical protein
VEQPEREHARRRGREPRSPVYYVQVIRDPDPAGDWVTVDVVEDRREAAQIAAAAARRYHGGQADPGRVRVIGSAELLRRGGQDAIHRAARDLWATGSRPDER